ncbi:MAG: hypothetical protein MUO89_01680 [Dehalococcoidia bacterium]|nr:hypothetical protein [Dehalococcoidia bacterium]
MVLAVQIFQILTPIVIGIGFFFAWQQWSSMRRGRMAQLVMSLLEQWSSPQMVQSRHSISLAGSNFKTAFEEAGNKNDIIFFGDYVSVMNFFDTLGVLVTEGYLDCAIAFDMLHKAEKYYYSLYESIITATPELKGNIPYFIKLHELFIQEEAHRSTAKKRRAL